MKCILFLIDYLTWAESKIYLIFGKTPVHIENIIADFRNLLVTLIFERFENRKSLYYEALNLKNYIHFIKYLIQMKTMLSNNMIYQNESYCTLHFWIIMCR